MRDAVIVSAVRTAVGKAPRGSLHTVRPDDMAAEVVRAAIQRAGLEAIEVEDFYKYYNSKVAGGTQVSSAYRLVNEIVEKENLAQDYNIYIFHGTDGDDWDKDGKMTIEEIKKAGAESCKLCFQCGKCDVYCPWNKVRSFSIRKIIREATFGLTEIDGENIWRCTTCGKCPQYCPRGVKQIEVGVSLRRVASEYEVFPASVRSARTARASLISEGNPLQNERAKRADWAKGLPVKPFEKSMEALYFVGCYLSYDPRMKKVATATARILEKAPSAELKPDQRDQDDLPPYELLDQILELYLEEGCGRDEIVDRGFDPVVVDDIVRRIRINEYKRKQAPMGLKVTSKAFGIGRRLPNVQNYHG